ncbi:MAG TPA: anti-sigma factor antagonist [bacterium]|nr:anti-sigma factor antagonist [bacterium]
MQGLDLKMTQTGAIGDIALMKIKGYLDTTTSSEVSAKLREIINNQSYRLIIDLGKVNYVSSAGWGVFVGEIRNIRENGGDLKIVQMTPDVYEVFEMLEFDKILDYYDTIEESITDFDLSAGIDITQSNQKNITNTSEFENDVETPLVKEVASKTVLSEKKSLKSKYAFKKPQVDEAKLPVAEKIKLIVIDNPNDGAIKIKKKLNTQRFGFEKVGILKVLELLKAYNLDSKEKRYRYYRSR